MTVMGHEFDTGQYVPIKDVLKHFLELPDYFDAIMSNLEHLSQAHEPFSNVVQGSMWKRKIVQHFSDKTVLPLIFFFDDMDPDNITGSHAGDHKLGALYYSIACLPQNLASKLDNIFLASIFLSECKVHGNMNLFQPVIKDLIDLEENGLIIKTISGEKRIYFSLYLLLGDNLGIHAICGLSEGFTANYPCRMCKYHRKDIAIATTFDTNKLRTVHNYAADVLLKNLPMTGIKENCVWNIIPSFSFVDSISFDIMHDLLEGVCHYDLTLILFDFIYNKKYFSLETLNNRIIYFDYGPLESGNTVPRITRDHLMASKFKFSASEMLCFIRYLGLMIGDLVPTNAEGWHLYIKLKSIIDIITAPYVNPRSLDYLSCLISEHHEMYLGIFPQVTLKPKHHYMLHYPQIMRTVGPLWSICCFHWEAKHRPFKQAAHTTNSCRNLPLTMAIKHQLRLSASFLSKKPLIEKYFFGFQKNVNFERVENYHLFRDVLPPDDLNINIFLWITIFETTYKKGMCLTVIFHEDTDLPVFGEINVVAYWKKN